MCAIWNALHKEPLSYSHHCYELRDIENTAVHLGHVVCNLILTKHYENIAKSQPKLIISIEVETISIPYVIFDQLHFRKHHLRQKALCLIHYDDVIMAAIASHITSLTIVDSIVYSDTDQRKHQSSASLAFVRGIHRDRWIPRTNGQLRGKCFHLMNSSCQSRIHTLHWDTIVNV